MKKKGYYIHLELHRTQAGVRQKIDGQIAVLRQHFDVAEIDVKKQKINIVQGIISRLPFGSYAMDFDTAFEQIDRPDFVYMRHTAVDLRYYRFLRKIREKYPDVKLILEIPTYPYKGELLASKTMWPFYFKDVCGRRKLKHIVDRIVTFSNDESIFGIPTIRTQNGIMVDAVTPVRNLNENLSEINLIAVSACLVFHGYERCIRGLADYYNKRKSDGKIVKLHMVGEGDELGRYKSLVKSNHLEKYVHFYGKKIGKDLETIYDRADVALGVFGLYKVNMNVLSPLKTKEYMAKGLPVVSGFREELITNENVDFYLEFANDGSNVDIGSVVEFYDGLLEKYHSKKALRDVIRTFAKERVDMSKTMEPVINYILGNDKTAVRTKR